MMNKVIKEIEKYHMLEAGDTVAAGISGGADSVCLLFVLSKLRKKIPFKLIVVHVNHLIRENAADDAAYVKKLCNEWQIPFFLFKNNVSSLARQNKMSEEEAGRMVRYQAFEEVLSKEAPDALKNGHGKIAVAHNLNDRAETMLFNLCRGSGLSGLSSIKPVNRRVNKPDIIRPLLTTGRREIEDFLRTHGISWCTDSTNAEDIYTRNKIRHHVLPYLEEEIQNGTIGNMCRAADILQETDDFIDKEAQKAYKTCVKQGLYEIEVSKFLTFHSVIQKRVILLMLKEMTPKLKDITYKHVEDILTLFYKEDNPMLNLPYQIVVKRSYEKVIFVKQDDKQDEDERTDICNKDCKEQASYEIQLPKPNEEVVRINLPNWETMEFKVFPYEKSVNISENQYTKWFDYDKIIKSLTVRTRQSKDYLTINDKNARKSIQDYMVNEKIARENRDHLWLLAEENHILWVIGHRISNFYKIDENTKYVLEVQIRGGQ